ncbi:hypothetical protein HYDPIDRAFT_23623 [Hydnomerulius pinastri MD-312]|nr:hypothetical protein HYDPIDRAFT_23623 [Hydnomerulius pinastri MD-312]
MPSTASRDLGILLVHGSVQPSVNEFLQHPDFRQIAAFFLGWVFICSLLSIASSPAIGGLFGWVASIVTTHPSALVAANATVTDVKKRPDPLHLDDRSSSLRLREDYRVVILMMFICFAFASVANFSSLLTFDAGTGSSACAFLVAWGGISASCARLFGLFTLCLELRRLHVMRFEIYMMCIWVIVAIAFVFAEYATNVGTTGFLPQLNTYLCYRVRYLPTSLAASLVSLSLESYVLLRLLSLIAPDFLDLRHRVGAIGDTRALRAASLLLLELLTMVPSAVFISIVGDFVPFTVGSLLVLAAFNSPIAKQAFVDDFAFLPPLSTSNPSAHVSRLYKSPSISIHAYIPDHPFATGRSSSSTIQIGPSVLWPHSTASIRDSMRSNTTAPSVETAKVHVASRVQPARPRYTLSPDERHTTGEPATPTPSTPSSPQPVSSSCGTQDHKVKPPGEDKPVRQRILSRQDEYAARLDREWEESERRRGLPIPRCLQVVVPSEVQFTPPPSSRPQSASSVLYGSDIIRPNTLSSMDNSKGRSSHTVRSTADYSSPVGTAVSGQSWMSLVRSAASADPQRAPERLDRWLMFGQSASSPTRRQTFSDCSLQSAVPFVTSPTESTDLHFRSSRLGNRTTFGERYVRLLEPPPPRRVSRRSATTPGEKKMEVAELKGAVDVDPPVSPGPRKMLGTRIKGPRPPPKILFPNPDIRSESRTG